MSICYMLHKFCIHFKIVPCDMPLWKCKMTIFEKCERSSELLTKMVGYFRCSRKNPLTVEDSFSFPFKEFPNFRGMSSIDLRHFGNGWKYIVIKLPISKVRDWNKKVGFFAVFGFSEYTFRRIRCSFAPDINTMPYSWNNS
mgnify:FL=1